MRHLALLLVTIVLVGCTVQQASPAAGTGSPPAASGTAAPGDAAGAAPASPGAPSPPATAGPETTAPSTPGPARGQAPQPVLAGAPGQPLPLAPAVPLAAGAVIDAPGAYVVEVASGRIWPVAKSAYMRLAWAIDGALARGSGEGLDVLDIEAGTAYRLVAGSVTEFAWSPDGRTLAFAPDREGMGTWPYPEGLYLVDRAGENLRSVATETGVMVPRTLQWSPDGAHLAWLSERPERAAYVLDLNTGTVQRIPDTDSARAMDFSPDGRTLALLGAEGLRVYDLGTETAWKMERTAGYDSVQWSPTGQRLLLARLIFGHRTHLADAMDADRRESTAQPAVTFETPSWAPDGERFAYISDGCTSEGWDIWTIRGLRDRTRLTHTPDIIKEGVLWSPAGEHVAYGTFERLQLADAASKEERTLAVRSENVIAPLRPLAWSPDGRSLAFHTADGRGVC